MGPAALEGFAVRRLALAALLVLPGMALADDRPLVAVVVGAEGTEEYGDQFRQWAERWQSAAEQAQAACVTIGLREGSLREGEAPAEPLTDRASLQTLLTENSKRKSMWLILIGHGTFDGKTARFNLRGPDITPADLNEWLKTSDRSIAIVNCTSSSGPFLAELSGKDRVVITATRSGHEYNFARLGDFLSSAITDPKADLDKDEQTSLLEAFLVASAKVREFYASESRLATEHALLDDNGDKLGTPADWFAGIRPVKAAKDGAALDGALARTFVLVRSNREEQLSVEVRQRRDDLERQLAALRDRKASLSEEEYLALLEPLLIELARLYEQP